ncbi:MAG: citrate transporter [Candidatus Pacebacteria bacterium]|nr:citrate transporter [Candidatus Paceibacterota bacterium]MBP9842600.1 citrate transporter [Candidatus Paceibacterota bacterium]
MFPFEFILFGATLLGVMLLHGKHLQVALVGLASIVTYKLFFTEVNLVAHALHETPLILNLLGLLVGFELMADHFQRSKLALKAPAILPDDWKGPFVLLMLVFVLSIFLDNIAAAMIGGSLAKVVFQGKVRVGYLAGIVAASNAGGAGSVIGDTTTTMMWIDGVSWLDVTHAFLPAVVALFVFGIPLSKAQQRFQSIVKDEIASHGSDHAIVDYGRVFVAMAMLVGVVAGNILIDFPAAGLWVAILVSALYRRPHWEDVPSATLNACFLLALVLCASLMPVETLPFASPETVFSLGFISAVFDNIPLTKLALVQGGYDWGWLAYSVGFGGSMMWFGSSAGVALAKDNPRMRDTRTFIKESWIIPVAYIIGFASLFLLGWHPHAPHK